MPWAGGVFSLLPVSHAEPGTTIRAEQQNAPHEDFTSGLNNCLTRDGSTLVVKVVENPIVNRVAFEGNHKLGDDQLRPEMQLRPRAVFWCR